MRIILFAMIVALLPASPTWAGGASKPKEAGPLEAGAPAVDLPPFMAPVTVNGELQFYMYMVVKLELTSDGQKGIILDKVPYIQDAILRDVHNASIAAPDDPQKVDEAAVSTRLKGVIEPIVGTGVIAKVGFRTLTRAAH
ncbi:MAG TPA: hypothetical protein DCL54_12945 [Alphaproteobacteria bacterium]|nr:hypothetical protein [Alphaproteobacteria bacterium]